MSPREAVAAAAVLTLATGMTLVQRYRRSTHTPTPRWVRHIASQTAYHAELALAVHLALQCGSAIMQTAGAKVQWKDEQGIDPCTATDEANEALVVKAISERFPSHSIIGEEASAKAGRIPPLDPSTPTWIVDPIDGTQNFVHGVPLCAVSIGLCVGGKPVLGVVFCPHLNELFVGAVGCGSYLNGRRLEADKCDSLSQAMVITDVGYERSALGVKRLSAAQSAMLNRGVRALRIVGSSVLSVCWVACGRASAFYCGLHEGDCPKPWDWCAAYVIATEAGVHFKRLDTSDGHPDPEFSVMESRSACCSGSIALAFTMQCMLRAALHTAS